MKKRKIIFIGLAIVLIVVGVSLFVINETNMTLTGRFVYDVSIVNLQEVFRSLITGLYGFDSPNEPIDGGGPDGGGGPYCGDGSCNGEETCDSCSDDCGECPPECGDGECNGDESCESCTDDCGECPPEEPPEDGGDDDGGGGGGGGNGGGLPILNDTFEAEIAEVPGNDTAEDETDDGGGAGGDVVEEIPEETIIEVSKTILEEKSGEEEQVAELITGEESEPVSESGEEGGVSEVSCVQKIVCGEWSRCNYANVGDVFSGNIEAIGYERRLCKDEKRCINDYIEERNCLPPEVEISKTEKGVSVIESGEEVASVRVDQGRLIIDL